ncbi:AbrB family transcriptional regulator [Budviciaceae bacterium BWR-B9]|uniref:AbrB family transcriptional regulator n=1 Tax=Limnobaculum allomyrinae TaxID=2791986 RepID=A0ABS1IUN7_9GAMM|nr:MULTISPECIES: AbrB family transcriptional regulator [Limnobaculum]MBK5145475.1 AbrB family transcriptional regulator [Limnobaculum allomyrinae]MBV7693594.1 AbrB family transcriptional regulator [Limnobaculum sp. M2-1]
MAERSPIFQWVILLTLSLLLSLVMLHFHIPAAMLLGPMVVGVTMSLFGATVRIDNRFFISSQAILGCMIAQNLSSSILVSLAANWPIVLSILLATLFASGMSGWLLVRFSNLPGTTGAWGSSPGGAAAMVAMSEEYGADVRLVAFMQYLRVLFVAGSAALVVRIAMGGEAQSVVQELIWFPPLGWDFVATLALAAIAGWLGRRLRFPSGTMLFPMLIGAGLHAGDVLTIQLPEWLLAMAYAFIGWSVGLRFNRAVFLLALRTLPQIVISILALMSLCALMALALTKVLDMDFLTAYLATSPGGLDTVAIIAAGSGVDMSFVMAMQTLRLFSILMTGPAMAKFISRHAPRKAEN